MPFVIDPSRELSYLKQQQAIDNEIINDLQEHRSNLYFENLRKRDLKEFAKIIGVAVKPKDSKEVIKEKIEKQFPQATEINPEAYRKYFEQKARERQGMEQSDIEGKLFNEQPYFDIPAYERLQKKSEIERTGMQQADIENQELGGLPFDIAYYEKLAKKPKTNKNQRFQEVLPYDKLLAKIENLGSTLKTPIANFADFNKFEDQMLFDQIMNVIHDQYIKDLEHESAIKIQRNMKSILKSNQFKRDLEQNREVKNALNHVIDSVISQFKPRFVRQKLKPQPRRYYPNDDIFSDLEQALIDVGAKPKISNAPTSIMTDLTPNIDLRNYNKGRSRINLTTAFKQIQPSIKVISNPTIKGPIRKKAQSNINRKTDIINRELREGFPFDTTYAPKFYSANATYARLWPKLKGTGFNKITRR